MDVGRRRQELRQDGRRRAASLSFIGPHSVPLLAALSCTRFRESSRCLTPAKEIRLHPLYPPLHRGAPHVSRFTLFANYVEGRSQT